MARATPLARSAAWATVSSRPTAWPAARNVPIEAVQATTLNARAPTSVRGPAGHREAVAQHPAERDETRPALDVGGDTLRARQAMRGDAEPEPDDEQRHEREPEQDGAGHDAADAQDEDRHGGDRDDHDRVDDALDDDRAQHRRPATPSFSPSEWLRTSSPSRAGRTLLARYPMYV